MAVTFTDNTLNYSGILYAKSNNDTRLLDAIYSRGRRFGDGIVSPGVRKVNSIEFAVSSNYDVGGGAQPAISEATSVTAAIGSPATRGQNKNNIQIFQEGVDVSYLKSSATGSMAGLNIAGQVNNVMNELDFQASAKMLKMKKDLNYTIINGVKQESTSNTVAWKTAGLISAITSNTQAGEFSAASLNSAIVAAMANGFSFADGSMELWVNPADLATINSAYTGETGFGLPATRTEGGVAITSIMTNFGSIVVEYDVMIPQGTYLLLNVGELAIAELDTIVDGVNKGTWFYEALAKSGASERGQIYGQAGLDYGAEWHHIRLGGASV